MVFSIDFTGKNYIVTGGNRGIGLAITRSIVSAGGNVAILYRSSASAPQVAEGLEKDFPGVKVKAYQCDVTDQKRVGEVFRIVGEEFVGGIVHGVVANAGVAIVRDALEIGQEEFDCMYPSACRDLSYHADLVLLSSSHVQDERTGCILHSASSGENMDRKGVQARQVFYNSSKAAVSSMSKALAAEWAPHGIRVNIVSPGYVATEQSGVHPKDVREFQSASVPLGRYSEPAEQTPQVLLLLSEVSSYQTGSEVFVDGGYLIW
ncbi:hypothetical protein QFC21_004441 [Naganishia friedmannii]|uniref:Uncharacterized protein n=1 Tax=Naganishia friedmannii TaxID=89922 RepID=A0ACC2VGP8_9TREE|nr:hypothetical protein QFC21_004441 [Naganishia friedmannii]